MFKSEKSRFGTFLKTVNAERRKGHFVMVIEVDGNETPDEDDAMQPICVSTVFIPRGAVEKNRDKDPICAEIWEELKNGTMPLISAQTVHG